MKILKQSTQVDILIGPLIDNGDFKSVEESVAYNAAGIDVDVVKGITKADVTLANSAGDGYWRHVANGYYALTLSTTDTGTLGRLRATFEATGVLPAWEDFVVVPANVYDSLVAGADKLEVDAAEISGVPSAADVADAVWDEAITDHQTTGSTGAALEGADATGITAADVWAYETRTLTSFGTLVADVWGYATRTLSDWSLAGAYVWAYATRTLTDMGALAADMDTQLSATHGAGSWEGGATPEEVWGHETRTLTSFGTLVADTADAVWNATTRTLTSFGTLVADIWAYSTRTITGFGTLIADLWGYATRTLTSFGTLAADVDTQLSGAHGAGSWEGAAAAPTVEEIDVRLSNTHGSGSWQGEGAGEIWGNIEVRYKLTEPPEGSGTPIADALVWVTTDEAGTNIVQSRRTNDFGYVKTPFYLDAGRYYFWRSKAGMNFVNPDVEDVS